jgi:hypothetical protein
VIHLPEIWIIIKNNLKKDTWLSLEEIYKIIESEGILDDEDWKPQAPGSEIPKWKRKIRNVLQYRKGTGEIEWDGKARYKL